MKHRNRPRARWKLAIAVLLTVFIGLASRAVPALFPSVWGKYPGDALWAIMVLFIIAFVRPTMGSLRLALTALAVSYAVEFSQLYQGAWLVAFRSYRVGHLLLGSGFDGFDLVAYLIGVAVGFFLEVGLFFRAGNQDTTTT